MLYPRQPVTQMVYSSPEEMIFGSAAKPIACGNGVFVGAGEVIPEVNFTLPPVAIREETLPDVRQRFREMVERILTRAVQQGVSALVLELEHLYELTLQPDWGALVTADIKAVMEEFGQRYGLRSALRVTVADIREQERPPRLRSSELFATMLRAFERCAEAGADILSIESTGGKEVNDHALVQGDMEGIAFALGVLAPRDMEWLWAAIVDIARRYKVVPGGDTACGFGNTAMQLAHQGLLPKVLAAVVRLMTVPRSLTAVEMGATGPLKDCGYENPVIKSVTGVPISMEGKSSACAHSSPLGNIAAAVCDLWSNESVQDVRLLGGYAPAVFTEILAYDCRLMNTALRQGQGKALRDLFVASDRHRDPQALMLDLRVVYEAGKRLVQAGEDHYARTLAMARYATEEVRRAVREGNLSLEQREERWLGMIEDALAELPEDADTLRRRADANYGSLYIAEEYGLSA
ncbi:MAG: methyltransferase MtaB domain-containing protein [Armatimonadota bacterium]|nr:methyltransferase MtaB domain-containing protein [Armatimonadota bacterium]